MTAVEEAFLSSRLNEIDWTHSQMKAVETEPTKVETKPTTHTHKTKHTKHTHKLNTLTLAKLNN